MKKKIVFVLAIAVVVLSCAGYSNATVLGTIEVERTGSVIGFVDNLDVGLNYGCVTILPISETPLYDMISWNFTEAHIGWTSEITAGTSPNFDNFVAKLTNGIDDYLFIKSTPVWPLPFPPIALPPSSLLESELIDGIGDGVDFEGYTIDSITLTVNELFLDYDEFSTHCSYDITYTINGMEVPEPVTILLLGLGGLALRKRRKA